MHTDLPQSPSVNQGTNRGPMTHYSTMVEMRDGVRLATEIFIPATVPVRGTIVERTPYGRKPTSWLTNTDSYFRSIEHLTLSGHAFVIQDCRGTGDSEGEFTKYMNEGDDGYDTLQWVLGQEWSNEALFLTGRSYSAHAALASLVVGAPSVRGLFLDCGGFWSAYHEGIRQGGAFELKQATWAFEAATRRSRENDDVRVLAALESQTLEDWIRPVPWQHGQSPLRFLPDDERALLDLWDRDECDEYWQHPSLSARGQIAGMSPFPSLHISGWYDLYTVSTVRLFEEMSNREGGNAYMIIGPWTHCALEEATAGDVDFGDHATIHGAVGTDYLGLRTHWFSYCSGSIESFGPRVRFFVMGGGSGGQIRGRYDHGGEWLESETWPPRGTTQTVLWLGSCGDLGWEQEDEVEVLKYRFDPADPVPTIGGSVGSYPGILMPGAFDQRTDKRVFKAAGPSLPLIARPDILAFSTAPLAEDLVIIGEIVLEMDFHTTAADTDITVKLVDVAPPTLSQPEGFAMNVVDSIVRLSRHEDQEIISSGNGDTVHRVRITLPPTANRFVAGHSLRVDISSSNFPRFDVNSNSGGAPRSRDQRVAINGVQVGGERGARIQIPVLDEANIAQLRFRRPAGLKVPADIGEAFSAANQATPIDPNPN